tara:strand:- start:13723 stop:16038 length:2316 start_codon:yes stop_codon:yes gene_type:complete
MSECTIPNRRNLHTLRRVAERAEKKEKPPSALALWRQVLFERVERGIIPLKVFFLRLSIVRFALSLGIRTVRRCRVFAGKVARLIDRLLIRFAMFVYQLAYKRRNSIRTGAADISDVLFQFQSTRYADRSLALATYLARRRTPLVGDLYFLILSRGFVFAIGVHMAAGQNTRAYTLARIMNLLFRKTVLKKNNTIAKAYFEIIRRLNLFHRIIRDVPDFEPNDDFYLNRIFGIGHLYALNSPVARKYFEQALTISDSYYEYVMIGRSFLLENEYERAAESFEKAVSIYPPIVMAHQNYAGRYDVASYKPVEWELESAGDMMIYDNLGQFAEEQFLHGNLQASLRIYREMLHHQDSLAKGVELPDRLRYLIKSEYPKFDLDRPTRVLPYEWVTQFGHIGLLGIFLKMSHMGIVPDANFIVLAPVDKTVNPGYLRYWEKYFCIVTDSTMVNMLFPYQRHFGENFMVCRSPGVLAEPWTRAGARAQVAWSKERRGPLISLSEEDSAFGADMLVRMNVPQDAWYVGLHAREGGFYYEAQDGTSKHRNSSIDDYIASIEAIVARGGIVIRLGDASMSPMPLMPGVIDYARSSEKSERMDLFLLATSRFVVGTTSGLTTATHSFGTPTVLVNCISNDWQLWDDSTDFICKKVFDRQARRYLTLAETYRSPVQGYIMNNTVLERNGYTVHSNSSDEILAAVKYKLDVLFGRRRRVKDGDPIMQKYRHTISGNPFIFGAARPVPDFLEMNPELLGEPAHSAFPNAQWSENSKHSATLDK